MAHSPIHGVGEEGPEPGRPSSHALAEGVAGNEVNGNTRQRRDDAVKDQRPENCSWSVSTEGNKEPAEHEGKQGAKPGRGPGRRSKRIAETLPRSDRRGNVGPLVKVEFHPVGMH